MKLSLVLALMLLVACNQDRPQQEVPGPTVAEDEAHISQMVASFHASLGKTLRGGGIDTDSLVDAYFDKDIYYVTPWGWTEPLDSTKSRFRKALGRIKDYDNKVEFQQAKAYGDGAYASFILRQNSTIDGQLLEEYLPTTWILERRGTSWKIVRAHRSTDYETFQQYIALQKKREGSK